MIIVSLEKARAIAHQLAQKIIDEQARADFSIAINQATNVDQLTTLAASIRAAAATQ